MVVVLGNCHNHVQSHEYPTFRASFNDGFLAFPNTHTMSTTQHRRVRILSSHINPHHSVSQNPSSTLISLNGSMAEMRDERRANKDCKCDNEMKAKAKCTEKACECSERSSKEEYSIGKMSLTHPTTNKKLDLEVFQTGESQYIYASELKKLNLMSFDNGFVNTAITKSAITYIDGDKGVLRYRGYRIEELVEKSSFLEVAYLLINGELPSKDQYAVWKRQIMTHTFIHENLKQMLQTFRYDSHPMAITISALAALGSFYDDANPSLSGADLYHKNEEVRNKQIYRILGKLPTIAACAFRHRIGRYYTDPIADLDYAENFLYMLDKLSETSFKPNPVLVRALDKLFILHADHEVNASTACFRHVASTGVDPYSACSAAASALYGPKHGGASEACLRMLEKIGSVENVSAFMERAKRKEVVIMGVGHRIYKNMDPRCTAIKKIAEEVFEVVGEQPLVKIARELEKQILKDEYFVSRSLYPNVDFYTGIIYKAMGFPTDFYPCLFLLGRAPGWIAHWVEHLNSDSKIYRPRQIYVGEEERKYVNIEQRKEKPGRTLSAPASSNSRRREVASIRV